MGRREELVERARDELFSHINHCEVIRATPDDREEWMTETIEYLAERYPELDRDDLATLRMLGLRFCEPPIPHGRAAEASSSSQRADER